MQEGSPVHYASKALTAAERNYAQIEKEQLAIVFACDRLDQNLYGRRSIVVESDHKPLSTIIRKPIFTAPTRLRRIIYQLAIFFTICKCKLNDTLVRRT